MTQQFPDRFRYRGKEYELAGISEGELLEPLLSTLGLEPTGTCSGCWRGYEAIYTLADRRLVLETLHVNLLVDEIGYQRIAGPKINGVSPKGPSDRHDIFNNHYLGINYPVDYTGGLLIADGLFSALSAHMGFHPAWKYSEVIELVFEKGVLQKEADRSEQMAEIRRRELEAGPGVKPQEGDPFREIVEFVDRCFDRRYRM